MTGAFQADMMKIVGAWKKLGGKWPAPIHDIVDFALIHGLYNAHARVRQMCARDLAEAMREEYITDGRGRPVRQLHAARFSETNEEGKRVQRTLWNDIDTADREFMEVAFAQRRQQIVGDCKQLYNDVEYFNNRRASQRPIQLVLDFGDDVIEANQPDVYIASRETN